LAGWAHSYEFESFPTCDGGYDAVLGGTEPVHAAAKMGAMSTLQFLIECEPEMIEFKNQNGASAAHFAAAGGQEAALTFLYKKLALLPNEKQQAALVDAAERTPAHYAAMNGQQGILRVGLSYVTFVFVHYRKYSHWIVRALRVVVH
jgi:ankyrin repeat protein